MIVDWVLVICTAGWGMCGQLQEYHYPSEQACYRALDELYRRQKREDFKYVVCHPEKSTTPPPRTP